MSGDARALLVYDGDCEFCRFWIDDWRTRTNDHVRYVTSREIAAMFPDVPREKYARAVQLIDEDGSRHEGAAAVFRLLAKRDGSAWWLRLYEAPLVAPVSEWAYRWIARHRPLCFTIARLLWGPRIERSRYGLTGRILLQALSAAYFIAFISLVPQLPGLVGEHGLLPIGTFLEALKMRYGGAAIWLAPTLAWFGAHAGALQFMALLGAGAALLSFGGIFVAPCFLLMWILYLSLTVAGQDFTSFQGDALLLEAGFLAIFLVPFRRANGYRPRVEASSTVMWLYRFLTFRLMFSSGMAKMLSSDTSWRNLSALTKYFETQPLPTTMAWYAHQLPALLLKFATCVSLGVEILAPFLFLMPRRARALGAAITIAFQLALIATGNFALLNWLMIALCLPMLDDTLLERLWPRFKARGDFPATPIGRLRRYGLKALSATAITLGLTHLLLVFTRVPSPMLALVAAAAPFRVSNDYGLFSVVATTRSEIVIEGSRDGMVWKEYAFTQKPGDVKRRPGARAPFQSRLDWEMSFASLDGPDAHPWVAHLMIRLLQGSKPVLALLASNPFPDAPPTYVRATLYTYRFTTTEERARDGAWWRREMKATYVPPLTLMGEPL